MPAQVIVVAGPSGSGKTLLARRLGLPVLNLDDFYKDGADPSLPRLDIGVVDWDHPESWLHDEAVAAVETLCREGEVDVPVYDLAQDGRVGHHRLRLDGSPYFVAEGIFAHELAQDCRDLGLVADAICVHHPRWLTFARRLRRDLREHRKPAWVLLRRGLLLARQEPQVVAGAVAAGCAPMTAEDAYQRLSDLLVRTRSRGRRRPA